MVDASFIGSLLLPDKKNDKILTLSKKISIQDVYGPPLLQIEVSNILIMAHRSKRLTLAQLDDAFTIFDQLKIRFDVSFSPRQRDQLVRLAVSHGLTAHGSNYLEIALRLKAGVATHDKNLQAACDKEKIKVIR